MNRSKLPGALIGTEARRKAVTPSGSEQRSDSSVKASPSNRRARSTVASMPRATVTSCRGTGLAGRESASRSVRNGQSLGSVHASPRGVGITTPPGFEPNATVRPRRRVARGSGVSAPGAAGGGVSSRPMRGT